MEKQILLLMDLLTVAGNVTIEDGELKVGDVSGDNYALIKQQQSDAYGFDWQHGQASVIVNEQGTTNQALVVGDVDASNTYEGLFGISHSSNGGSSWTKKLDLRGGGDLYIGSSAQNKVLTTADEGSGNGIDADTVDGIQASSFLRSDTADTASGDITFSGGAAAVNIAANSDIRLASGSWTGDSCKIQHHDNWLYIQGGSNGIVFRRSNGTNAFQIGSDGTVYPSQTNTYDLGTSSYRWRDIYTMDLQLSNEARKDTGGNDVDGTWGDWTLQEGEDDIFMINNRNGKKFRIKMEEV